MPVDIKGKEYVTVNERILEFRKEYEGLNLTSEMLSNEGGVCIFKATISNHDGVVRATGHAYEKEGSTFINKTSYIENCETSAWGRALANLGIGIDASVASADEVGNAVKQQVEYISLDQATVVHDLLKESKADVKKFLKWLKVDLVEDIPLSWYEDVVSKLEAKKAAA